MVIFSPVGYGCGFWVAAGGWNTLGTYRQVRRPIRLAANKWAAKKAAISRDGGRHRRPGKCAGLGVAWVTTEDCNDCWQWDEWAPMQFKAQNEKKRQQV
jgi:hypothetical protein